MLAPKSKKEFLNGALLKFAVQQPFIDRVIIGVETNKQLVENLTNLELASILPELQYKINENILIPSRTSGSSRTFMSLNFTSKCFNTFDTAKEKPQMGKILAVGPGKASDAGSMIKMSLKSGDKVLYGKYSGTEVNYDGDEVLIMRESDVLAVL